MYYLASYVVGIPTDIYRFFPRGVGRGCSKDNPPIWTSMCAQSASEIQSRPFRSEDV